MNEPDHDTTVLTSFRALALDKWPCLLMMAGASIGQRYPLLDKETMIGRSFDADIVLDDVKVSRFHAKLVLEQDGVWIEDLGSTNKTYVDNCRIERCVLQEGALISVGSTVLKYTHHSGIDTAFHEEVVDAARLDSLTRLVNRRFFERRLQSEFLRARRYATALSLLVCDLDDFKQVNDNHGHAVGDRVLQRVADVIRDSLRKHVDLAGRFGGEELLVLLPETGIEGAAKVGEKIRLAVAALSAEFANGVQVGISIGAAELTGDMDQPEQLFELADQRLYQAKAAGKNRVQFD